MIFHKSRKSKRRNRKRSAISRISRASGHIGILALITLAVLLPFLPTAAIVSGLSTQVQSAFWPAYKSIHYSTTDPSYSADHKIGVFNRGVVTLTFDDSWRSIYTNGLQEMEDYHINSTQYILTGTLGQPLYMTTDQVEAFKRGGHQIASHTLTHPDLTKVDGNTLEHELADSRSYLENYYKVPAEDFASPLGAFNDSSLAAIKRHYRSHRSTQDGFNTRESFDIYNIRVQNITSKTTQAQFESWLVEAKRQNAWLVLVYHQVQDGNQATYNANGDAYSISPATFEAQLEAINRSHLPTATIDQVLDEILQK